MRYSIPNFVYIIFWGSILLMPLQVSSQNTIRQRLKETEDKHANDPDSALVKLVPLFKEAMKTKDGFLKAEIAEAIGNLYHKTEKYSEAITYYSKSIEFYNSIDSIAHTADILISKGVAQYYLADYEKATTTCFKGLEIAEKFNNQHFISMACQDLGMIYCEINENDLALKFYNKAYKINKQNNFEKQNAGVLQNIGIIFSQAEQLDSAIKYYHASLDIFEKYNDTLSIAICYNNIGILYERKHQYDTTLIYHNKAYGIFKEMNYKHGVSQVLFNIGQILIKKNKFKEALSYLDRSLKISKEIDLKENIQDIYYIIASVHDSLGDYENAHTYLKLAYDWWDTIYTIEQAKQIAEFEAVYQSKKRETEILMLEKQQEKQRNFMLLLAGILIVLLMTIIFIIFFFKLRNKALINKALAQEQTKRFKSIVEAQESERKRIAEELHDSVGPLLSLTQLYISDLSESKEAQAPDEQELFVKTLKILGEACDETRNISHNLMPGVLIRSGLIPAIRELTKMLRDSNHFDISLNTHGIKQRFEETIEITYYRVLQELLNNIIKHSSATTINLELNLNNNTLLLNVQDNGKGFDVESLKHSKGIGWKNIVSRLSLINGGAEIHSDGQGTHIQVSAPYINP